VDLIGALKDRNVSYVESSKEIIEHYSDFLNEVFQSLSTTTATKDMIVDWATLDFHPDNPALVNVVGIAQYKVGSVVQIPDSAEVLYIDEDNVRNFRQPIRVVLPTKELSGMMLEASVEFVREYTTLLEYMENDEIEIYVSDPDFMKRHFTAFGRDPEAYSDLKTTEELSPPKPLVVPQKDTYDDFDLSDLDLDDVQVASLKILGDEGKA